MACAWPERRAERGIELNPSRCRMDGGGSTHTALGAESKDAEWGKPYAALRL